MIEFNSSLPEESCGLTENDKHIISSLTVPVPDYENDRMKILRQTRLLDSEEDVSFDRFTALAQRIFNVPIALVSLVDVNRQWFKSRIGLDVEETHRNYAFCSYTVLPDSPEVLVVGDAAKDARFSDNPLVTGPPFIRFYAGAALIVAGVRVGSLCVIDRVPHEDFDIKHRMNLLDLGEAVSMLMRAKRDAELNLDKARMQVMVDMVTDLRPPLAMTTEGTLQLKAEKDIIVRALRNSPDAAHTAALFEASVAKLEESHKQLYGLLEQLNVLGQAILQATGKVPDDPDVLAEEFIAPSAVACNVINVINSIRQKLTSRELPGKIKWLIDSAQLSRGMHKSHPEAVTFVLLTALDRLAACWQQVSVHIHFQLRSVFDDCAVCLMEDDTMTEGALTIEIRACDLIPKAGVRSVDIRDRIGFKSIERILKDVRGGSRVATFKGTDTDDRSHDEHLLEVWVPCIIVAFEEGDDDEDVTAGAVAAVASAVIAAEGKEGEADSLARKSGISRNESPAGRSLQVLLADDNAGSRELTAEWFKREGCNVSVAVDGAEAQTHIQSLEFDIVLMDILMPVRVGTDSTPLFKSSSSALKASAGRKETLIIGMSEVASIREQDDSFEAGVHFYLAKPLDQSLLNIMVRAKRTHAQLDRAFNAVSATAGMPSMPESSTETKSGGGEGSEGASPRGRVSPVPMLKDEGVASAAEVSSGALLTSSSVRSAVTVDSATKTSMFRSFMQIGARKIRPS